MNTVHVVVALLSRDEGRDGFILKEYDHMDDLFQQLVQGDGLARVSTTYQRAMRFGEEKVVVTITCACDQNEASINRAGELLFRKAVELVDENYGLLAESANQEKPA